jgi:hypothetical protein
MNRPIQIALAMVVGAALTQADAFARGFGGLGGFHAGGFGAGGFGGGGFHAGGFETGGFHAGGFAGEAGGFHAGGFGGEAGGFRAGGGSLSRGQLSSFLGLPTDGGTHAAEGAIAGGGAVAGPGGAAAWRGGATARTYQGPMGTTVYHGAAGVQGAAVGPGGAAAGGRYASGTAVEGPGSNVYTHTSSGGRGVAAGPEGVEAGRQFSSTTSLQGAGGTTVSRGVSGAQGVAAGPGGYVAGGTAAAGRSVQGPGGNVYRQGAAAQRGVAAGPYGYAAGGRAVAGAGYATGYGTRAWSPTYYHAQAIAGQRWFAANPVFTSGWAAGHAWAWHPAVYAPAAWAAAAWAPATWPTLGAWLGLNATPAYYDYGDNITIQGDNVYYGSQSAGTTAQYYQEAVNLAGSSGGAGAGKDTQWMPLGVFGLMAAGQSAPEMVFQLALDKQGVIRGNYYDQVSQDALPVEGSVNKKNQRVAWRVGSNKKLVIETGLYNLTKDESTALVHFGPDQTQQYVMVRMKQPEPQGQPGGSASAH